MLIKEKLRKFEIEISYPKKLPIKKPIANIIQSVNHWKLFFEIQNNSVSNISNMVSKERPKYKKIKCISLERKRKTDFSRDKIIMYIESEMNPHYIFRICRTRILQGFWTQKQLI